MSSKPVAISYEEACNLGTEYLYELKIDGSRLTYDGCDLFSDRRANRSSRYWNIWRELGQLSCKVMGEVAIPGSNILELNKKENWSKAKFYIFDIKEYNNTYVGSLPCKDKRQIILDMLKKADFKHLLCPMSFTSFYEGWEYVRHNNAEGLVIKNDTKQYKIKKLIEEKLPILRHEPGSLKGSFWFDRKGIESKTSGNSVAFVQKYKDLISLGQQPYVEIEYQFLTSDGKPFQPRTRAIGTWDELNGK
jgi:hypothetical protein